jgi:hypothetical protein
MKNYSVVVEGSPVTIDIDGEVQRVEFTVTRFVRADDLLDAERRAIDAVREDLAELLLDETELAHVRMTTLSPPKEVKAQAVPRIKPRFGFFPAEETLQ